ncbi:MAG: cytochrome c [Taibaiella sp.]|nr:cytochrome c [Taibaiella sp.]
MKRFLAFLISFFAVLICASMTGKEEGDEETGLIVKYNWNKTRDKLFKCYYQEFDTVLLTCFQVDPLSKAENGIYLAFENQKDTAMIAYYKMGKAMPLSISISWPEDRSTRSVSVGELSAGPVFVDPWRSKYQARFVQRNDSVFIDYLLGEKVIFKELYYWGERKQRNIINTAVYDSVLSKYNSRTGAQIFKENCTSCHQTNKNATGPKLAGVTKRRSEEWLRKWIRSPAAMIAGNDPQAVALYNLWHKTAMTSFPMPEAEMNKLIDFLKTL